MSDVASAFGEVERLERELEEARAALFEARQAILTEGLARNEAEAAAEEARQEAESLRKQVEELHRHNDKLHRRIADTLPTDYTALKGEVRKAWEKVKARERSDAELRSVIAKLEGKVERQSARITRSESDLAEARQERDRFEEWWKTETRAHNHEAQRDAARIEVLEAALRYAAGMPDAEHMPEWAKELRHRARAALQPTPDPEEVQT